jgi:DNA-binding transcriptional regulator YiaG
MATMVPVLNEHIRRLARREVRAETLADRRRAASFRREIAELKRLVKGLAERVERLERGEGRAIASPAGLAENARFRADGLRSHRARLGISAQDYGRLVGVSALSVYNWESGKARPRRRQLAALLAARPLGKREVMRRLAGLDGGGRVS